MKPKWEDAPDWANWLAMDEDGTWCWHEEEPDMACGVWGGGGRMLSIDNGSCGWQNSKEKRP